MPWIRSTTLQLQEHDRVNRRTDAVPSERARRKDVIKFRLSLNHCWIQKLIHAVQQSRSCRVRLETIWRLKPYIFALATTGVSPVCPVWWWLAFHSVRGDVGHKQNIPYYLFPQACTMELQRSHPTIQPWSLLWKTFHLVGKKTTRVSVTKTRGLEPLLIHWRTRFCGGGGENGYIDWGTAEDLRIKQRLTWVQLYGWTEAVPVA